MAASRLTVLLILTLTALLCAARVNGAAQSLEICSAPTCVFRNGTQCDRTTQECPRCVMYDSLLDTVVCTNLLSGGAKCLSDSTLCPATPLETTPQVTTESSETAYHWLFASAPDAASTPSPSPQPSAQPRIASSIPPESASALSMRESQVRTPTWIVAVFVAAAVGAVALVFFVVFVHNKQPAEQAQAPTSPPPPPFNRNGNVGRESFMTLHDDSPTNIDSFPIHMDKHYKPSTAPTMQMSGLAFSYSYGSHSGSSELEVTIDSWRSESADWWEIDSRGSNEPGDIALLEV